MSKIVRVLSRIVCCFSVMVSSPVFAGPDQFIASQVKPHFAAYADCAKQYLRQAAKKDPAALFERIESSLRPACGNHIDLARDALFRGDFGRSEANAIIRSAYASMQPGLRSLFDQAAASERQRHQVEKEQATQAPRGEEAASVAQDRIKAVELERTKLLTEAASAFDSCLVSESKSLVPLSNEPAETLVKVIEIKCGELEKRVASLGVAFYGASKDDYQKIVKEPLDERKKRLVADIVTLRADLAKEEAAKQQKDVPEADGGSKPTNGN
ncbi:hypothetical protein [Methylocystis sp. JR02]|uniref:hypothetical protein n=1 Tax=Methylocystis sp. JR02 TaxID=3046284 RepID=UPI0024BA7600|nr:hypothetical protein [Methylocystis sp. JR02]MDJ0448545.1 hypothetical protein [Methylocystis sp. JR02]